MEEGTIFYQWYQGPISKNSFIAQNQLRTTVCLPRLPTKLPCHNHVQFVTGIAHFCLVVSLSNIFYLSSSVWALALSLWAKVNQTYKMIMSSRKEIPHVWKHWTLDFDGCLSWDLNNVESPPPHISADHVLVGSHFVHSYFPTFSTSWQNQIDLVLFLFYSKVSSTEIIKTNCFFYFSRFREHVRNVSPQPVTQQANMVCHRLANCPGDGPMFGLHTNMFDL